MTFTTERRVEFRDTDAAGLVHFSAFFPMMEAAEHAMFRSLGMSVMPQLAEDTDLAKTDSPLVTWPRVAATCDYIAMAKFEDLLTISVNVARIGKSSVQYRFRFRREEQLIADGTITTVCCELSHEESKAGRRGPGGLIKTEVPSHIRELLEQHAEGLGD